MLEELKKDKTFTVRRCNQIARLQTMFQRGCWKWHWVAWGVTAVVWIGSWGGLVSGMTRPQHTWAKNNWLIWTWQVQPALQQKLCSRKLNRIFRHCQGPKIWSYFTLRFKLHLLAFCGHIYKSARIYHFFILGVYMSAYVCTQCIAGGKTCQKFWQNVKQPLAEGQASRGGRPRPSQ